jgi:hypothetical protein
VGHVAIVPSFKPVQTESINSNTLKFILNNFKLDLIQNGLPKLKKFKIKYGCEGFEERNTFINMKFFILEMHFELKIWEFKICF